MAISFDENGVNVFGVDEARQIMIDKAQISLAPYSNGLPLKTDDSSVLGRIFSITCVPAVQTAEILPAITSSLNIDDAEGIQVDNLAKMQRTQRLEASQSTGLLMLYGELGTTIVENSQFKNSLTGDVFYSNNTVTLDASSANGVTLTVSAVSGVYTLSYSIDGYLSESPNIVVQLGSQDTTISAVATRIVDAVNSQSSYLTATKNNDNTVDVIITDQTRVGDFAATGNMSITHSFKPTRITSLTYGSQEAEVGRITTILTSINGLLRVTNPFYIYAAQPIESDNDLKFRMSLKGSTSISAINAVIFALRSVSGVTYANVQTSLDGVYITVQGGNEDEIALAIFNHYAGGFEFIGGIEKTVKDVNGGGHTIRFSRTTPVPLEIRMTLTVYPDFPNGGQIQIKQALVEWFNDLNVGEDIYYSRLYEPINKIKGFSVKSLKIGRLGGTLGTNDVIIGHNEIATISADNIYLGG